MKKQTLSFQEFILKAVENSCAYYAVRDFFDYKREDIQADEVDIHWIVRFAEYINGRVTSANTKQVYFTIMRTAIKKSIRRGYKINVSMEDVSDELTAKKEASEAVFTSKDELKMLESYNPVKTSERFTRAVYLLMSYTGCRLNDHKFITENSITNGTISFTCEKTKRTSRVPMHPIIPELIKELKTFNYSINSEKLILDNTIKRIFLKLGLTNSVSLYRRGERQIKPKYELISAHTARRSFATNLYLDGYSIEQIKRMMGHSNSEMTSGYIIAGTNDFITGDKNYLFPDKRSEKETKIDELVKQGISIDAINTILNAFSQ